MQVNTDSRPYDTINVTPMLDLAYVLLVIFIIMTTAGVQGITINLPKPSNKPSLEKKDLKVVQVTAEGAILLNGAGLSMGELEARLTDARARDPEVSVMVKGDPRVQYDRVIAVVDLIGKLKIGSLGLVTSRIGT